MYSQILSFCIISNSIFICTIWAITQKLSQTANYLLEEGGAQKPDEEKIVFSKTQPILAVSFVTLQTRNENADYQHFKFWRNVSTAYKMLQKGMKKGARHAVHGTSATLFV